MFRIDKCKEKYSRLNLLCHKVENSITVIRSTTESTITNRLKPLQPTTQPTEFENAPKTRTDLIDMVKTGHAF